MQLTLVQLDNYGPWTVKPSPKPEPYIQSLQGRLFSDIEEEFSARGGLVFSTRFDNMLAVSNGISLEEHENIQEKIHEKYPVTFSMGVGVAEEPYEAQRVASDALRKAGGSRSPDRKGALVGKTLESADGNLVQIAHIDVNHSTSLTNNNPIYDTHHLIQRVHLALMSSLVPFGALVFYMGGDNFMAPSNGLNENNLSAVFEKIKRGLGAGLKAGVGIGVNAVESARLASQGLHDIRNGSSEKQIIFRYSDGKMKAEN
ncbi:hypothetical protein AKJ45_01375 [candidate division MSBL1 archaeon SCGC-AAA261F19]|uniref:GTP cyclohydrolase III n=1 Tax=candidate division MSBL1 archaeon SCGC-AAA261F19 TaxID=1698275 RepID=A0A133VAP5_9EURY|nr:hypothetical protein AKJ45_01375 [candidate division MSBL1 archaeon SCGC-AAA261F19]